MLTRTITSLLLLLFGQPFFAQVVSIAGINGWKKTETAQEVSLHPDADPSFRYTVFPILRNETAFDWLETAVKADEQKNKFTEKQKPAIQNAMDIRIYVTQVADETGKTSYVCYMGYRFGRHSLRLARTMGESQQIFQQYTTAAVKHFSALYQQEKEMEDPAAVNTKPDTPVKPATPVKNPLTKMNGGMKNTDLQQVIMHLEYEVGVGGGIYPVYNAYILLKDGTVYKYPEDSPYDLDIAASKKAEPRKWGTWKMKGDQILTSWPAEPRPVDQQETWEAKSYYKVSGAKKGETLKGVFKSISGGGNTALGGDVMTVSAGTLVLNEKGQFSLTHVAGVSSPDQWETHYGKRADAGTYALQDYMIELNYHDGRKERRFFFFYPDSKLHFGIGTTVYMPKK